MYESSTEYVGVPSLTIAMAAVTDEGYIVTVSDRLISFGDLAQGVDNITKGYKICDGWGILFAADNANLASPYGDILVRSIHKPGKLFEVEEVKTKAAKAYRELFDAEFSGKHLSRYRFDDVTEFRATGLKELGETKFNELCSLLDNFNIGLSIVVFGHDLIGTPHVFRVENPGVVLDNDLLGISVIGSGSYIALGTILGSGSFERSLTQTIHRLLEAKFAAEAATGVGRSTTVLTFAKGDKRGFMFPSEISVLRTLWNKKQSTPIDPMASSTIDSSNAVSELTETPTPLLDAIEGPAQLAAPSQSIPLAPGAIESTAKEPEQQTPAQK